MPRVTCIPQTRNRITSMPTTAMKRRRVAAYARVSTDSDEQFTSYEAQVYQSGVFDTGEYERTNENSQMNKDFRGFTFLQKSLWFVDHMRLLLHSMQSNRNASRLLNVSCRVVGLSCKGINYHVEFSEIKN